MAFQHHWFIDWIESFNVRVQVEMINPTGKDVFFLREAGLLVSKTNIFMGQTMYSKV